MTRSTRLILAKWLSSTRVNLRLCQATLSASSSTSRPILLQNLKQSADCLGGTVDADGGSVLGHRLDAVAVGDTTQASDAQGRITQRGYLRRLRQRNPYLVRHLRTDLMDCSALSRQSTALGTR